MQKECIREIPITDTPALKEFAALERRLLARYPLYTSYFDKDVIRRLSRKSAFTRDVETALFVASDGQSDLARCAAQINPRYQAAKNENVGFIGYFAAAPDSVPYTNAMLERAEDWLRRRAVTRVIAPFNSNALIGAGCMTAGFEDEAVIYATWSPPYYPETYLKAGYHPTYPIWDYEIDMTSEKFRRAEVRARENRTVRVRPISKRHWKRDLEIFRTIINENFLDEWEWYPTSSEEFEELFGEIKIVTDPKLMLIAEIEGKPVGVRIAFPDWNPLIRKLRGRFGLREQLQFLIQGRRYSAAGLAITAVKPEYRGMGISPLLGVTVCHHLQTLGVKRVISYFINDANEKSRHAVESIGGVGRIVYHAFDKLI